MFFSVIGLIGLLAHGSCTGTAGASASEKPFLNGLTTTYLNYVKYENNKLDGFAIDLMTKVTEKAGFSFEMKICKHEWKNDSIATIFEDSKVDFAIDHFPVTDERKKLVDFTEPFQTIQMAVLVRKDKALGSKTLDELVEKKGAFLLPPPIGSTEPTEINIKEWLEVASLCQESHNCAMLVIYDSNLTAWLASKNCNLIALPDTRGTFPEEMAIALPKGSPYLASFNKAIRELKEDGTMDQLIEKHWKNTC